MATKRVRMPSATLVVARSYPDNVIGIENQLPWHLGTDLRLFKQRTKGHAVIMGSKTYRSIGRPLPNRTNIVLSRSEIEEIPNVKWANNISTALFLADVDSICRFNSQFFVIGGEQIYKAFDIYINKVYLTEVFCGNINGDAKFEQEFDCGTKESDWIFRGEDDYKASSTDDFPFRITCFQRRKPNHRYRVQSEFTGREIDFYRQLDQYELVFEKDEEQFELKL